MKTFDLIRMGLKNLWRRKLRTFLTILGVIIGTGSIVVMVSLGIGMNEMFKAQLRQMGSLNTINVYGGNRGGGGVYVSSSGGMGRVRSSSSRGNDEQVILDDEIVEKLKQISGVEAVTPLLEQQAKFVAGKYTGYVSLIGIDPTTMEAFEFEAEEGRLLEESDKTSIVFGSGVKRQFYDPRERRSYRYGERTEPEIDFLEDRLEFSFDMNFGDERSAMSSSQENEKPISYKAEGVGILSEGGGYEMEYNAYINIYELKRLQEEYQKEQERREKNNPDNQGSQNRYQEEEQEGYQRVMVRVPDINQIQDIQKQIQDMGLNAYSLTDQLESMKQTSAGIQAVLGGIGAVALLVAAIGITNTMIMSIYERTREIGVMKVIGAALGDIRRLFLFEAGMIGLIGGLMGLGVSYGISYLMNSTGFRLFQYMPDAQMSVIPMWLAGTSLVFTTLVGLISGFYPARRAMKLSALEAIKTE